MPAARSADVFAQELRGGGIEQADGDVIPLHIDPSADPARGRA
jgi:hypothetical protein